MDKIGYQRLPTFLRSRRARVGEQKDRAVLQGKARQEQRWQLCMQGKASHRSFFIAVLCQVTHHTTAEQL